MLSSDLVQAEKEIGCRVEQFLSPDKRFKRERLENHYAIDNGAFAGFDAEQFLGLLEKERQRRDLCRFVAVPDVVGSARRTLEVFHRWKHKLTDWPLAYVCQDGQENLPIPWNDVAAIFIGGNTDWKMGQHAAACVKAAKAIGKWVHAGRVNTPGRFEYFEKLGADSLDGTGLSRYSWMREAIYREKTTPELPMASALHSNADLRHSAGSAASQPKETTDEK